MRLLHDSDLPAARSLLERVGLPSGATNLARYLRWQPDGCWCSDDLAGMVTIVRHGHVGFVGCMAVEPAAQGQGLGRQLLEHAQRHARDAGVTTLLLEATPVGAWLYTRLGYVVEHESWIVSREGRAVLALQPIEPADRLAALALDRVATATPRPMIASLFAEFPGLAIYERGELTGFGLVVDDRLGPVIARSPAAGDELIRRLAPACTTATVLGPNVAARAALSAAGFRELRQLHRMRLGPPIASHTDWIWTLASSGAG